MAIGKRLLDEPHERRFKSLILSVVCGLIFSILIISLFRLQVLNASVNIQLSKENSMREAVIVPPRGRILDRNGLELARNRPSYAICVLPYKLPRGREERDDVIRTLCSIRDIEGNAVFDSASLAQRFRDANRRRFELSRIKEDVTIDVVSIVEERYMELPGILVETESRREYPYGAVAFHAVGYMGEIPEKEFDTLRHQDYYWGDLMGRAGLERQYESVMRGICGREYLEVDVHGKSLGAVAGISRMEPQLGHDLYLSLDINMQQVVAKAFPDSLKGGAVAIDPRTGEVLVMFSNPSVDPNIFSAATNIKSKVWAAVQADRSLPLNNRAIAGVYPPGSTFKPLTGLAGLATGRITKDTRMPTSCHGSFRLGSRIAKCHKPSGHGSTNYVAANQYSCNVFFYQLGLRLGDERINHYARMFGLGEITGVDLPGERMGYLSGEKAYNERFASRNWRWTPGLAMDMAIGQQQVLTPLQLALMVGGMGNGSYIYRPRLLSEERSSDGVLISAKRPSVLKTIDIDSMTRAVTREALLAVVKPGGTGTRAAVPGINVGGKTGSAQNPHGDLSHALFIACAPVEDPVIAVAVAVENAGGGGAVAAPIAGELLRYFFSETLEGQQIYERHNPGKPPLKTILNPPAKTAAPAARRPVAVEQTDDNEARHYSGQGASGGESQPSGSGGADE